ncbi:MAG: hypothetical protein R3F20_07355 [Planctomycetota bacterium]
MAVRIAALGLLGALVAAPGLWLEHPWLTSLSIFGDWPRVAAPWDRVILGLIGALALAVAVLPRRAALSGSLLALLLARGAWDLVLWQPYFLQYAFFLGVGAWCARRPDALAGGVAALRFAMIGIYVWSGFSKLHLTFFEDGLYTFWGPEWFDLALSVRRPMGFAAALIELALGLALIRPQWRRWGRWGLLGMHVFLLVMLGPLVRGFNPVVWPWNLAMIALLLVLFRGEGERFPARELVRWRGRPLTWVAMILFAVGPALSYFGAWSTYLSFRLYAYRYDSGFIVALDEDARQALPPDVAAAFATEGVKGAPYLDIFYWSEGEIGAFLPGDALAYRRVAERILRATGGRGRLVFVLKAPPTIDSRERVQTEHPWVDGGWK